MQLKVFRHLWGVDGSWEETFPKIKDLRYAGIETSLPAAEDKVRLRKLLEKLGLDYIVFVPSTGKTVQEHIDSFRQGVEAAVGYSPRLINSQSGQDSWGEAESIQFYEQALEIEAKFGVTVTHETHRGRVFYNPWTTARILDKLPNLKVCCDLSHWVNVCERLLDDQLDNIKRCAEHCYHIHARVGYEEGPQVPDPRAPEYQRHLEAHERWWNLIWDSQQKRGLDLSTLTPEFGPPGYLHTLPFTNVPVTDLWEVCNWQAQRQADNFSQRISPA